MDCAGVRRLALCRNGLFVLLLIAFVRSSEAATAVVTHDPLVALRGFPLNVNVFTDRTGCTFKMNSTDVFPLPPSTSTEWTIDGAVLSVNVLVKPTAAATLTCTVACSEFTKTVLVDVTSDVVLNASMTSSPNPADEGKAVSATVTLLNSGGHPALDGTCSFLIAGETQPDLDCPKGTTASSDPLACSFNSLLPHESINILLSFPTIKGDTPVNMTCHMFNVPNNLTYPFSLLVKEDAKLKLTTTHPDKVAAGASLKLNTVVSNSGTAQADGVLCVLAIEKPAVTKFTAVNHVGCVGVALSDTDSAIASVHCNFSDILAHSEKSLEADFAVLASVEEGSKLKFEWTCSAVGLDNMTEAVEVATSLESGLQLELANANTAGGTQALLFGMKAGPSYVRDARCSFAMHKDVQCLTWSQLSHANCSSVEGNDTTTLTCVIAELHPPSVTFSLGPCKVKSSVENFFINTTCTANKPASTFTQSFNITVGSAAPTPSPTSNSPLVPATDNTLVMIVTVIVAIGLLIVMAIWWRRKQDRHGWDAAGPNARSPSLNRFTEMELSVRSEDD